MSEADRWYNIFCGSYEAMKMIADNKARALNPKTHKFQIIDNEAKYEIVKDDDSSLYFLESNKDLRKIAEEKGLIL